MLFQWASPSKTSLYSLDIVRANRRAHGGFHFLRGGPDFAEVHRLAVGIRAQGFRREIQIHTAG